MGSGTHELNHIMRLFALAPQCVDFPGGSDDKESTCNARDPGSIPGSRRFPGVGNGNPLQYSCLENPLGRGESPGKRNSFHRVAKSQTQLK